MALFWFIASFVKMVAMDAITDFQLQEAEDLCKYCTIKKENEAKLIPVKTKNPEKRYFCDSCGAGFAFKYALKHHFKFHEKIESKLYVNRCCHICMEDMKSTHALRSHLLTDHDITWKCGNSFNCQKCLKPFDDLFKLRMHLRLYHNLSLPNGLKSPRGRDLNCQVCHQTFTSERSARTHMRKVHDLTNNEMKSLKSTCEECGKMFSVKQNLLNHINSAHLKIKPMSCDVCGERFVKHSSLIFHKLRHTGEKPFLCALCQKTYRQRNDVVRHLARHVRDKELDYETAYAVNTSSSKHIFKRMIYLKDSTIKGLKDIAESGTAPRKRNNLKKELMATMECIQPTEETYQEIVVSDGAVLVERNFENEDVQYIFAEEEEEDEDDSSYVINLDVEESGNKYNVFVDDQGQQSLQSPSGVCYFLKENDAGQQYLEEIESEELVYTNLK